MNRQTPLPARRCSAHGFTLVEVLVALFVMASMAAIAWKGLDTLLRSREISQTQLQQAERLQAVLAQWELDLRQLQDSGLTPRLAFDGINLRLTRQREEGLQVVTWTLVDGRLYRWEDRPVRSRGELEQSLERSRQVPALRTAQALPALDGLLGWQMYFYRDNAWSNAMSSGQSVNGVRMRLEFAPGGGLQGTLTRQVVLEGAP